MSMLKDFKINIFIFTILSLGIFSFGLHTNAQTPQQIIDSIQNNVQVSINPQFPRAGDTTVIHLQSNSTDLSAANISWIVGGKTQSKGFGMTDFSVVAGAIGSLKTVLAHIVTSNGGVVDKTITIQPADIDLLWQVSSYVPPFYQGKALYPHQGLITLTAVPNVSANSNINKSMGSYVYTWKKDDDVLGDFSGYGKNTFSFRGSIISRPFTIEVDVASTGGVSLGVATATIQPQSPQVSFYEKDPLLGVLLNHKLSNFTMQGKEFSVSAVPFYFNTGSEPYNLTFDWTMNGQTIPTQSEPSVLTVRNSANASGSTSVGLQITNVLKTLQFASNSMTVNFTQTNNQTGL